MNYKPIHISNPNLDNDFITFIQSHQKRYENIVLGKSLEKHTDKVTQETEDTPEKKDIKTILENFFFSPKYDNVFDLIKGNKKE